ncbi:hypothetical protein [Streptomyces sp. NPDC015414]|uniref:hypothetical protein n=1 Tax=Streptomyces sp. NPDC015414 TaxID=3364957 RepID=UPI0036FA48FB
MPEDDPAAGQAAGTAAPGAGSTTGRAAGPDPGSASGPGQDPEDDPAAPAPLGVPRTATGSAEVDAQLQRLADADHLATDGHVEVYEDVHRGLRDALTALDTRPGPPVPVPPYQHRS